MTNPFEKFKHWWNKTARLEAEIGRLKKREEIAIDALKDIATKAPYGDIAVQVADVALREIGLTPFVVSPHCPPDQIYFVPKGMGGRPTDYV